MAFDESQHGILATCLFFVGVGVGRCRRGCASVGASERTCLDFCRKWPLFSAGRARRAAKEMTFACVCLHDRCFGERGLAQGAGVYGSRRVGEVGWVFLEANPGGNLLP